MREFFELYEALPSRERQLLRKRLIKSCRIEPPTWYSWMNRRIIPKPSQKLISIEMDIPIDELFPNATNP